MSSTKQITRVAIPTFGRDEISPGDRVEALREQYDAIKGCWSRSRHPSLAARYEGLLFGDLREAERAARDGSCPAPAAKGTNHDH